MRENFVVFSDKNDGYPGFSDSADFDKSVFSENKGLFIVDSSYPKYRGKNYTFENHYYKISFFAIPDINDGYPIWLDWYGFKQKIFSDIYNGDNKAKLIYFKNMPVKIIYFREKVLYKFGYGL